VNTVSAIPALDEDHHVHSTFSDDAVSTMAENVSMARERGLRMICLADHVRRDSPWVAKFVSAVDALRPVPGLEVLAGIEAKILDRSGRLDLPDGSDAADVVLIADHQFPGDAGPVHPEQVRKCIARGDATAGEVIDCLIEATANALRMTARPQLAHLFSMLPKLGLDELAVPAPALADLAQQARRANARMEVNEKWACPSARTIRAFAAAGVSLVASTDSHDCRDIGTYVRVRRVLADAFTDVAS
jgi:putative hydrolase